jgi:uncharacterized protein
MGPEVIQAIVHFVERKSKDIDHLDISWFGGEPLINLNAVLELSRELKRVCATDNVELHGFMSTNAFLLSAQLLSQLVDLGISRYQITFDGPKSVHDNYRIRSNGGPTFERIWENVRSFRDVQRQFEVLIRVHVTPATVSEIRDFLEVLATEFGRDARFKITLANVSHWGGPNDDVIPVFKDPGPVLGSLKALVRSENEIVDNNTFCNAANPAHLVIRPNGTVVKCAHSLDLEQNQLGYLSPQGHFVYRAGTMESWIRGLVSGDRAALRCPRNGIEKLHSPKSLVRAH